MSAASVTYLTLVADYAVAAAAASLTLRARDDDDDYAACARSSLRNETDREKEEGRERVSSEMREDGERTRCK